MGSSAVTPDERSPEQIVKDAITKIVVGGVAALIPFYLLKDWFASKVDPQHVRVEKDENTFIKVEPVRYNLIAQWPVKWGIPAGIRPDKIYRKKTKNGEMYVLQIASMELNSIKRRAHWIASIVKHINRNS